jgi:hypothetical protein
MGRLRFFWEFGWLVLSFFIVLAAWLAAGWATAQAQSQFQPQAYGPGWNPYQQMSAQPVANKPRTVVVGVDLSQSNPLVRDDDFARRVAERIRPTIASLAPRSRVMLRSFGSYNGEANTSITLDVVIAPRTARAEDIAGIVAQVIATIPARIRAGKLQAQPYTNIVPFLQNMSRVLNCQREETYVILATDGVEDSQLTNLKNRNATLPQLSNTPFAGCQEMQILGIGRGLNSPRDTERLIALWREWAARAGFRNFTALNDW